MDWSFTEESPTPPPLSSAPSLSTSSPPTAFLVTALGNPVSTSSISITSPTGEPLYTCALHPISKPHVTVTSTNTSAEIGTVVFHALPRRMTLVGSKDSDWEEIKVGHKHVFKSGYQYKFLTLEGEVKWKSYGEGSSILVDGSGNAVARFDNARWNSNVKRTLEVVDWMGGEVVEEALVTSSLDILFSLGTSQPVDYLEQAHSLESASIGSGPGQMYMPWRHLTKWSLSTILRSMKSKHRK
ncbi:MAG: hypothetical protein Q9169_006192 [Polycauliona sp. 2 TL-2023]